MTPEDSENQAIEELEAQYSSTEDQIQELEKKIKGYQAQALQAKENGNPELLSNTLIRLARVNSALGNRAAYAKKIARDSDRAYRRIREQTKLDKINEGKMAIGKAESAAYIDNEVANTYQIYSAVQFLADSADDLTYRTDTFLKMAQSGLSLIKNDLNDGRR